MGNKLDRSYQTLALAELIYLNPHLDKTYKIKEITDLENQLQHESESDEENMSTTADENPENLRFIHQLIYDLNQQSADTLDSLPSDVKDVLPKDSDQLYLEAFEQAFDLYKDLEIDNTRHNRISEAHEAAWNAFKKCYF